MWGAAVEGRHEKGASAEPGASVHRLDGRADGAETRRAVLYLALRAVRDAPARQAADRDAALLWCSREHVALHADDVCEDDAPEVRLHRRAGWRRVRALVREGAVAVVLVPDPLYLSIDGRARRDAEDDVRSDGGELVYLRTL
ncbi:hypothetical protein SAMN06297387_103383 [Streptomyces zhaozhouensis]|uniref:Resolvase, N terminal domain n=1 Tax=Streptomyces zhaozhouensis TaxID=1300267 RepID=A0A286DT12_9ACTN|nr:hypothetical protein SAMN06297387_103383 [Streptomyces zhaozhouensis]